MGSLFCCLKEEILGVTAAKPQHKIDVDRITQQLWAHADQPGIKLLTQAQRLDETASALGKKVKKDTTISTYGAINKGKERYNT